MKLGEIKDLTMSNELKYIFDRSKCFTQMVALPDPTLLNVIRINSFAVDKLFFDLKNLEKATLKIAVAPNGKSKHKLSNLNYAPMSFEKQIVLENITFQYPNTTSKALDEISLTIKKGQSIGIIGKSGSGKTTLVDVILGLFEPQFGDVKVDVVSVYKNLRAWQDLQRRSIDLLLIITLR